MKHPEFFLRRRAGLRSRTAFGALLVALSIHAAPAMAQYAVLDSSNLAETSALTSTSQNQLVELSRIRNLEESQLATLGEFGSLGSLFGSSPLGGGASGGSTDFYTNMQNFAFDPCTINLCTTGDAPVGTTDLEEARSWAYEAYYANTPLTTSQQADLREVRRRGVVYAATNGVALATITSNDLAGAGAEKDALQQIVESAQTLRDDVRANSAIALASYEVELKQLAMLTAMLEVESVTAISDTGIYHEEGASDVPDAYIDADFSQSNSSQRISVTPPKKGSAGGFGSGGGLMAALGGGGLSDVLGDGGALSTIMGSDNPMDGLSSLIEGGEMPGMNPDDFSMETILSDAASVAGGSLPEDAPSELRSGMSLVQTGLSEGGPDGTSSALMGLAQSRAASSGDMRLASALNTGGLALRNEDPQAAISFAEGTIRDLRNNGDMGRYADYLRGQITAVENGSVAPSTLVLDSSAILANAGSQPNADASRLLQLDPEGVSGPFLRDEMQRTLQSMGMSTGSADIQRLADTLSNVGNDDVESLRAVFRENAQGTRTRETNRRAPDADRGILD